MRILVLYSHPFFCSIYFNYIFYSLTVSRTLLNWFQLINFSHFHPHFLLVLMTSCNGNSSKLFSLLPLHLFCLWVLGLFRFACMDMGGAFSTGAWVIGARVTYQWLRHWRKWHSFPPSLTVYSPSERDGVSCPLPSSRWNAEGPGLCRSYWVPHLWWVLECNGCIMSRWCLILTCLPIL